MVGHKFGHFEIVEKLGAGGMGVVYRARDHRLERDVAVKVLSPGTLADPAAAKRFLKEAHALSSLNHPNIATVYHFDTQDGVDFLVMEYVTGVTLDNKLMGGPLEEKQAVSFGLQLAEALGEAHQSGIIHSDLKPRNIMVTDKGRLKVLDFGLAKILATTRDPAVTQTRSDFGVPAGTLPYMAPEQLLGKAIDARADIYASGVVLYQLVTASLPFSDNAPPQLITAILKGTPPRPRVLNPRVSVALEKLILKALERDPARRHQTARELLADLQALCAPERGPSSRAGSTPRRSSLAVLPLLNADGDPECEYLSDGITEMLINDLSQLPQLRVMARTSVFRFKNQTTDPQQVGKQLGVRAVLTGKVSQHAGLLSVQVELVNVPDGSQLWGERYRRRITDIITVQEDIAKEISQRLQLRLTHDERKALTRYHPINPEAYQLYLRGRYFAQKWTVESVEKALTYFHDAIRRDANYALAYTAVAEAYYGLCSQFVAPSEAMPKIKQAALKALEIDETLAEAHVLAGVVKAFYEHDFPTAEAEFRRGIQLNDRSAAAHQWYAYYLAAIGKHEAAATQVQAAYQLDPLSGTINVVMGIARIMARDYQGAVEQLTRTLELDPDLWMAYVWRGFGQLRLSHSAEALTDLQRAARLADSSYAWGYLANLYAASGNRSEAEAIVRRLETESRQRYVSPHHIAIGYVAINRNKAFEWLETAYQNREEILVFLNVDPTWDEVRWDPRFTQLLTRVGLSS